MLAPQQLETVAIGKWQPIAPNNTSKGRALNRRVEFMVSSNQDANVSLVKNRTVNVAYLDTGKGLSGASSPGSLELFSPDAGGSLRLSGKIELRVPSTVVPQFRTPTELIERPLDDHFKM